MMMMFEWTNSTKIELFHYWYLACLANGGDAKTKRFYTQGEHMEIQLATVNCFTANGGWACFHTYSVGLFTLYRSFARQYSGLLCVQYMTNYLILWVFTGFRRNHSVRLLLIVTHLLYSLAYYSKHVPGVQWVKYFIFLQVIFVSSETVWALRRCFLLLSQFHCFSLGSCLLATPHLLHRICSWVYFIHYLHFSKKKIFSGNSTAFHVGSISESFVCVDLVCVSKLSLTL